jgi:N-acetylglucosaminyldiphosphoundecaprenol N-acetyl-beta-D-mannosaminyltransferase
MLPAIEPVLLQAPQRSIQLLGVRIHILPLNELVATIARVAGNRQRAIIGYVHTHGLNMAHEQPPLRAFFNTCADYVFCDGFGVKLGARLAGLPEPYRHTPADWIDVLCDVCVESDLSMYLLGGRDTVAQRSQLILQQRHPRLRIAGAYHGYFDKTANSADNAAVIQRINEVQPDILLVGFGMPAQEYWLRDNWSQLRASVAITVGGLFDCITGEVRRAPRWMTDHALEWLGRLFFQPTRVWRRYVIGNPLFLSRVMRQRLGLLRFD